MPDITIKTIAVTDPEVILGVERNDLPDPDVMAYFHVNADELSASEKKKLAEISSWLNSQSDKSMDKWQTLHSMRYKLGTPTLGNSEIDHIHKYVRLKQAVEEHEAQLEAMTT